MKRSLLPVALMVAGFLAGAARAETSAVPVSAPASCAQLGDKPSAEESSPEPKKLGPFYSPFDARNWLANFQATYIWQRHPGFEAAYTGPHSLLPVNESGYTLTSTLFVGFRPWSGAELFFNPETIQSVELSNLTGLGGESNGENQKSGSQLPIVYLARLFLRQTFDLGGAESRPEAEQNRFASKLTSRHLVLTLGYLAVTDIFDDSAYSHDPRASFINWALWTYGSSDFAADSRGYTLGAALELYWDNWAFRLGRFAQPLEPNGLALDFNLIAHFGDALEVEHRHTLLGRPGKVRIDGFHNRANMGAFQDALDFAQQNGGTPDVANVRKTQSKFALGLNVEQAITNDVGLFARLSWNDGRTETYAYAEIERSFTLGAVVSGGPWHRPDDLVGIALAIDGISPVHRTYLGAGGLGFFIGDGQLTYGVEQIAEAFYSARLFPGMWFSLDGQFIVDPAYNRDRGPVKFLGCRFHFEG